MTLELGTPEPQTSTMLVCHRALRCIRRGAWRRQELDGADKGDIDVLGVYANQDIVIAPNLQGA